MRAFIYNADIYCERCGQSISNRLKNEGVEDFGDSNGFPQGPYGDGGGEADTPQHCGACRAFLENPLTRDGVAYVRERLSEGTGDMAVLRAWSEFYGLPFTGHGAKREKAHRAAECVIVRPPALSTEKPLHYVNPQSILSVRVEENEPNYGRGRDGYGTKIPMRYLVKLDDGTGRERRVYCCCISNSGSIYLDIKGTMIFFGTWAEWRLEHGNAPHPSEKPGEV